MIKRLICFFRGHPCVKTGRHGYVLTEHQCQRCGRIYVSHSGYGDTLMPGNSESDKIFSDVMWLMENQDKLERP